MALWHGAFDSAALHRSRLCGHPWRGESAGAARSPLRALDLEGTGFTRLSSHCFDVRKLDRNDRNDAHVTPASSYVLNCEARTGLLRVIYMVHLMVHGCIDRHPCIAA